MYIDQISSALVFSILFNVGITVFFFISFLSSKKNLTLTFALFASTISAWCVSIFFYRIGDKDSSLIWARILYIAASLIPLSFLVFIRSFINENNLSLKRLQRLVVIFVVLIAPLILFTELFISQVIIQIKPVENTLVWGPLYYLIYLLYIPSVFIISFIIILNAIKREKGKNRGLLLLILSSSVFTSGIAMFTNLILPTINDFHLNWFGQFATILWVSSIVYAILRYQFLDVRLFIGRITYFSLNAFIAYVVFYLILYINLLLFKQPITPEGMLLGVVFSILFVLVYDATNRFIREKVTLRIINPGFDPNVETARLNKKISSMLGISQITKAVFTTLAKTIRPSTKIILLNNDKISDVITDTKELKSPEHSKTLNIIFNKLQQVDISYLNYFEVQNIVETANLRNNFIFYKEVFQLMVEMELRLVVTIRSQEGKIIGLICLGPKDSDIPYTRSEQNFVYDIGEIISLSVDRSLLYKEVQQFNETLQDKVDIATRELTQANTKLAEALKKEKDMMDIIGHELRTPLGAARNALIFLDTLKQKGKMTDARFKQFMETAIRNIRREKEILETILQSARLDNDRIQFDPTDVNIQELIKQSFEGFGDMAKQKNLEVILDIEPRLTIRCDQVAIQQIVDNLASNAVKYTHKGSITIRIKKVKDSKKNKIRFEFIDTGEGIKPEDIPNLGKKFFRANTHLQSGGTIGGSLVPRPGGTGIGLYVIKGLLESMGSELKIESEFGKGSKFWFELEDSFWV